MTGNGLLGELAAWSGLAASPPPATRPLTTTAAAALAPRDQGADRSRIAGILDVCDQVIGESSRREHIFDWLQSPGGGGRPVIVEAYYPRHQLVVLTEEQAEPDYSLSAHLIPEHGLRLFRIRLADFTGDSGLGFSRLLGELRFLAALPPGAPTPASAPPTAIRWNQAPPAPAPARSVAPAPAPAPAPELRPSVSSAFQPLVAAVQRFAAAPQPFVMPPEPEPEPPPAPPPVAAPVAGPAPVSAALQRYLTTAPPPPPPPAPPPVSPTAPAWQLYQAAPRPQAPQAPPPSPAPASPPVRTPLPFVPTAVPLDPVLAHLVPPPERDLERRRVGQHQAEAAARAARFVEARHRGPSIRNGAYASVRPAPSPRPAPRPPASEWRNEPATSPFAVAFPVTAPAAGPASRPYSASTARAAAIERALAKGRSLPDRDRRPPAAKHEIDPDDIPLAFTVASAVLLEVVLGAVLFVAGGPVVLGFGLLLDAAARVLGTVAAARSGKEWGSGWRWICGLGGSAGVVVFAFQRDGGLVAADPAPLAGPVAVLALVVLLVGLAGLPAGI